MPDVTENQNELAANATASASGEPGLSASVPVAPASSGSTDMQTDTPSTATTPIQTSESMPSTVAAVPSTTAPVGTVGEQGNVSGAGDLSVKSSSSIAPSLSGSPTADAPPAPTSDRSVVVPTPSTDTQTSSPTGGPIAGRGDTVEARAKHGVLDRIKEDLRAELHAVEELPHHILHILSAVFDRHHSKIDTE